MWYGLGNYRWRHRVGVEEGWEETTVLLALTGLVSIMIDEDYTGCHHARNTGVYTDLHKNNRKLRMLCRQVPINNTCCFYNQSKMKQVQWSMVIIIYTRVIIAPSVCWDYRPCFRCSSLEQQIHQPGFTLLQHQMKLLKYCQHFGVQDDLDFKYCNYRVSQNECLFTRWGH